MNDTHDERGGDGRAPRRLRVNVTRRKTPAYLAISDEELTAACCDHEEVADLRKQLAAATACAEKAEAERDEARELARASLYILRNVSDEPMRELFEVDDMDELPGWFTGYGKPSDAVAADASPEGLSEPVERSETSGGHGEGSNPSATAAGLSEPRPKPKRQPIQGSGYTPLQLLGVVQGDDKRDDTTEDGQHG